MTMKSYAKLKRNRLVILTLTWGIWRILAWALESIKNFLFNGFILSKVYIVSTRKVIYHETEEGYKIWRGVDLSFQNWHKKFDKFSPEYSKVSKLELWWDPFVQSIKCVTFKFTEELCVMTMKNDTKIIRNWLVILKTWGTSQILTRALESLQNLCFNWLLVTKVYLVWATKVQRSYLSWYWREIQILKKNSLVVWKKDLRNLANFYQSTWKYQNWDFDEILSSKVEKVWP